MPNRHSIRRIMSGEAGGVIPSLLRGVLGTIEPFYAGAVRYRNWRFDRGIPSIAKLPHPVISVGNITTGGTGKTPVIEWLATRLRERGRQVAILSRGYKSSANQLGDELTMLDQSLNRAGKPPIYLCANPNRLAAAQRLLQQHPEVDVFLLDDGFQHRRLARDLDIVLISAAEPFGWGHVLPRGMLREPLTGLKRAGIVIISYVEQATAAELMQIEAQIRRYNPIAPILRASHAHARLRLQTAGGIEETHPMSELNQQPFFLFCGIGNPDALNRQMSPYAQYKGHHFFGDHHAYSPADLRAIAHEASQIGAQILVTTEKDYAKVSALASSVQLPIWRIQLHLNLLDANDASLLSHIDAILAGSSAFR